MTNTMMLQCSLGQVSLCIPDLGVNGLAVGLLAMLALLGVAAAIGFLLGMSAWIARHVEDTLHWIGFDWKFRKAYAEKAEANLRQAAAAATSVPKDIRILLKQKPTAAALRKVTQWLFEDTDQRQRWVKLNAQDLTAIQQWASNYWPQSAGYVASSMATLTLAIWAGAQAWGMLSQAIVLQAVVSWAAFCVAYRISSGLVPIVGSLLGGHIFGGRHAHRLADQLAPAHQWAVSQAYRALEGRACAVAYLEEVKANRALVYQDLAVARAL